MCVLITTIMCARHLCQHAPITMPACASHCASTRLSSCPCAPVFLWQFALIDYASVHLSIAPVFASHSGKLLTCHYVVHRRTQWIGPPTPGLLMILHARHIRGRRLSFLLRKMLLGKPTAWHDLKCTQPVLSLLMPHHTPLANDPLH